MGVIEVFESSAVEDGGCSPAINRDHLLAKTSSENPFSSLFIAYCNKCLCVGEVAMNASLTP